jgi:hypothetical protein
MPEAQFLGQIATPDDERMRPIRFYVNLEDRQIAHCLGLPAIVYYIARQNCAVSYFATDKTVT